MPRNKFEEKIYNAIQEKDPSVVYEGSFLPYTITTKYIPDFQLSNGIYIETKGYLRATDRQKMLLVKKQHPNVDIRFVFQNARKKINKKSKTTYGDWASKHGFLWCEKTIPDDWVT